MFVAEKVLLLLVISLIVNGMLQEIWCDGNVLIRFQLNKTKNTEFKNHFVLTRNQLSTYNISYCFITGEWKSQ